MLNHFKVYIGFYSLLVSIMFYSISFVWLLNIENPYNTSIFTNDYSIFPLLYVFIISIPVLIMGTLGKEQEIGISLIATIVLVGLCFLNWSYDPESCLILMEQYYVDIVKNNKEIVFKSYDYLQSLSLFFTTLYVPYFGGWVFILKRYLEFSINNSLEDKKIRGLETGGIPLFLLSISICCNLVSLGATYNIFFAAAYLFNQGIYIHFDCIQYFVSNQFYYFAYAVLFLLTSAFISFYNLKKGEQKV